MQFSTSIATFLLAITASAAPHAALEAREATSGDCAVSIYSQEPTGNDELLNAGACGLTASGDAPPTLPVVAMGKQFMNGGNGHYDLCGKTIEITVNGITKKAVVADLCVAGSIDVGVELYKDLGGSDGSNIPDAHWTLVQDGDQ